jgi:hypothetical protein
MVGESSYEQTAVARPARPERVICVLGMHRSGTSCLTGSLQQRGLFLGEHNTRAPWNLRGNRESHDMWRLQEDILVRSGGSWDKPPETVEWRPEHVETARGLLAAHAEHPVWGFKDPRTVLTFEGWKRLVPDLEPVAIFRHPLRVAQSLEARNKFPLEKSLSLWQIYNERLLQLWQQASFPIVWFDEEADVLNRKLLKAGEIMGLDEDPVGEPFFTDELRHSPAEGGPLPPEVETLYEKLRALAL